MSPTLTQPSPSRWTRIHLARLCTRGLAFAWLAFWLWFATAASLADGPPPWPVAVRLLLMLLGPPLLMLRWPRVGGVAFAAVAIAAAVYFPGVAALLMLALPAAIVALLLLLVG